MTRIRSGEFAVSTFLPKLTYFASSRAMSNKTVAKVYRRLLGEGLLHKRGRRFAVGRPDRSMPLAVASKAYLLVLTYKGPAWTSMARSARLGQFCQAFIGEAQRQGIRLLQVVAYPEAPTLAVPGAMATGREAIANLVQGSEGRYLGVLIAGARAVFPDLREWIAFFLGLKRPVVWLDLNDDGNPTSAPSPLYTRCHFSETAAMGAALDYLAANGHHRLAYIYTERGDAYSPEDGWQARRLRLARSLAQAANPPLSIVEGYTPMGRAQYLDPEGTGMLALLESLRHRGFPATRRALGNFARRRAELLRRLAAPASANGMDGPLAGFLAAALCDVPHPALDPGTLGDLQRVYAGIGLARLLDPEPVTAVMGPNDETTRAFHLLWLKNLGLSVPGDVSVISFDNAFRDSFFPLTSVDMGFGYLGYQAFHALVGDIPVDRDRRGDIPAKPAVVDRGSVADIRARRGRRPPTAAPGARRAQGNA